MSTSISAFAGTLFTLNYGFTNPSFIDLRGTLEVIFAALIGVPALSWGPS